jgi:hypothetical protein
MRERNDPRDVVPSIPDQTAEHMYNAFRGECDESRLLLKLRRRLVLLSNVLLCLVGKRVQTVLC